MLFDIEKKYSTGKEPVLMTPEHINELDETIKNLTLLKEIAISYNNKQYMPEKLSKMFNCSYGEATKIISHFCRFSNNLKKKTVCLKSKFVI